MVSSVGSLHCDGVLPVGNVTENSTPSPNGFLQRHARALWALLIIMGPGIITSSADNDAGGIAIACHPFALFKGSLSENVSSSFDAIETINARAFPFGRSSRKAEKAAERFGLSRVAGTDAHYGPQIGSAYTVIDAEPNVQSIAKAIVEGRCQPFGTPVSMILNLRQQYQRLRKMIKKVGKAPADAF